MATLALALGVMAAPAAVLTIVHRRRSRSHTRSASSGSSHRRRRSSSRSRAAEAAPDAEINFAAPAQELETTPLTVSPPPASNHTIMLREEDTENEITIEAMIGFRKPVDPSGQKTPSLHVRHSSIGRVTDAVYDV